MSKTSCSLTFLCLILAAACGGGEAPARTPDEGATPNSSPSELPAIVDPDEVFAIRSSGGEPALLHTSARGVSQVNWSPDGAHLAFLVPTGADRAEVYLSDGFEAAAKVAEISQQPNKMIWSPKSDRLAVASAGVSSQDGKIEIAVTVVEITDGAQRQIYSEAVPVEQLPFELVGWTLDGSGLLTIRGADVIKIDAANGTATAVASAANKLSERAALSSDGSRLALLEADPACDSGSALVLITLTDGGVAYPQPAVCGVTSIAWSPDGRELAYASGPMYVLDIASSGSTELGAPTQRQLLYTLEWLRDGSGLAAQHCYEGCTSAGFFPAQGGSESSLVELDLPMGTFGGFAPDSRRYLYSDDAVRIATLDGQTTALTQPDSLYGYQTLAWSPNGDRVAYVRGPGETPSRYAVDVETGAVERLPYPAQPAGALSPDGSKALFKRYATPQHWESVLWISNTDGTGERLLVDATTGSEVWSPDSQSVAYLGPNQVSIVDVDSGEPTLVPGAQITSSLSWSPDGSHLAGLDPEGNLAAIDLDSGERKSLAADLPPQFTQMPLWSPDSEQLLYVSGETAETDISIVNVDEEKSEKITGSSFRDLNPAWSPDGKTVAFLRLRAEDQTPLTGDLTLMTISAEGRDERALVPFGAASEFTWSRPLWSPDGSRLAIYSSAPGAAGIYRVDLHEPSLQPVVVGRSGARGYGDIDWSDDGRRLLFSSFYVGI